MKSNGRLIFVLLVLAAVAALTSAMAMALWSPRSRAYESSRQALDFEWDRIRAHHRADHNTYACRSFLEIGFGVEVRYLDLTLRANNLAVGRLRLWEAGWPYRCIGGEQWQAGSTPGLLPPFTPLTPTRVDILALVGDTLVYAACAMLILQVLRIGRRLVRTRRRQCPACGYPRGPSACCPECGKPIDPFPLTLPLDPSP